MKSIVIYKLKLNNNTKKTKKKQSEHTANSCRTKRPILNLAFKEIEKKNERKRQKLNLLLVHVNEF